MSDSNKTVKSHAAFRQFRFETETVAVSIVDQTFSHLLSQECGLLDHNKDRPVNTLATAKRTVPAELFEEPAAIYFEHAESVVPISE